MPDLPVIINSLYTDLVVQKDNKQLRYLSIFHGAIILVDNRGISLGKYRETELIYYKGRYYPANNLTPNLGLRPDQIVLPEE